MEESLETLMNDDPTNDESQDDPVLQYDRIPHEPILKLETIDEALFTLPTIKLEPCLKITAEVESTVKDNHTLQTSLVRIEGVEKYKCPTCIYMLDKHSSKTHICKNKWICSTCNQGFLKQNDLSKHKALECHYLCTKCGNSFKSYFTCHYHKRNCGTKTYKCEVCGKNFLWEANLREHLETHKTDKEEKYICENCNKDFKTVKGYNKHVKFEVCGSDTSVIGNKGSGDEDICTQSSEALLPLHYMDDSRPEKDLISIKLPNDSIVTNECMLKQETSAGSDLVRGSDGVVRYRCKKCENSYRTYLSFNYHKTYHCGNKTYKCEVCRKNFLWEASLREHLETHKANKEEKFTCENCNKDFRTVKGFNKHVQYEVCGSNTSVFRNKSSGDKDTFPQSSETLLPLHDCMDDSRPKQNLLSTKKSNSIVTEDCMLKQKASVESIVKWGSEGGVKYNCIYCKEILKDKQSYNTHILKHANSKKFYNCNTCGMTYSEERKLEEHTASGIHLATVTEYNCVMCGAVFPDSYQFKIHHRIHDYYLCNICHRQYFNYSIFTRHLLRHTGKKKPHCCNLCNKTFKFWYELRIHLGRHKKVKCLQCDKGFSVKDSLKGHTCHVCHICSRSFVNEGTLQGHLKLHVHAKRNQYRGNDKSSLHSGALKFDCTVCLKEYKTKSGLGRHAKKCKIGMANKSSLLSHETPKIYCSVCLKEYESRSGMRKHAKKCKESLSLVVEPNMPEYLSTTGNMDEKEIMNCLKCNVCNLVFDSETLLKAHKIENNHEAYNASLNNASQSDEGFALAESSITRQKQARGHMSESYCKVCGKVFDFSYQLIEHVQSHHQLSSDNLSSDKEAVRCAVCGLVFDSKPLLREHTSMLSCGVHSMTFNCGVCRKGYKSEPGMKKHAKTCKISKHTTAKSDRQSSYKDSAVERKNLSYNDSFDDRRIKSKDDAHNSDNNDDVTIKNEALSDKELDEAQNGDNNDYVTIKNEPLSDKEFDEAQNSDTNDDVTIKNEPLSDEEFDETEIKSRESSDLMNSNNISIKQEISLGYSFDDSGIMLKDDTQHSDNNDDVTIKNEPLSDETETKFENCHECNVCKLIFSSEDLLKQHKVEKDHNIFNTVTKIKKEVKSKNKFKDGSPRPPKKKKMPIPVVCHSSSKESESLLLKTVNILDQKTTFYYCNSCGKTDFKSDAEVKIHKAEHEKNKFKCNICGKGFEFRYCLQLHLKNMVHDEMPVQNIKQKAEYGFKCLSCNVRLSSMDQVRVHIKNAEHIYTVGMGVNRFTFNDGDVVFSSVYHLKKHIAKENYPYRKISCKFCGLTGFRGKYNFDMHVLVHTKNAVHIQKKVEDIHAFTCNHCGRGFQFQSFLNNHLRGVHNEVT